MQKVNGSRIPSKIKFVLDEIKALYPSFDFRLDVGEGFLANHGVSDRPPACSIAAVGTDGILLQYLCFLILLFPSGLCLIHHSSFLLVVISPLICSLVHSWQIYILIVMFLVIF